jgi:predicted deacetylase
VVSLLSSLTFDDISPTFLSSAKFEELIEFLNEMGLKGTFFCVPYILEKGDFVSYLKMALDCGHELALHGYVHAKNEFGGFYPIPLPIAFPSLERQKANLEKGVKKIIALTGIRPLGFRAPFYLYNYCTLKALSSLGFRYDSSATFFKPAHTMRLRLKWLRICKPFVTNGVVEFPVCGDYTYSLRNDDFGAFLIQAIKDFERVKSCGGVFVLNNHPQRFNEISYRFLNTLVKKLSGKTEFVKLCDALEICK